MSAPVRLVDVHKSFGAVEVLRGVSLDVAAGEAVCIIGPSGSGKSTLLRCINGLVPVDRGEVHVGPHAVHALRTDAQMVALRKDVSIVFQQYNLFPHRTALQNVMMAPVQVLRQPRDEVEARCPRAARQGAARRQGRQLPGRAVRAASSSASRSRVRSPCGRRSCCSTR
jgi:polar amino acid transport system ATP-binding protein